MLERVWRKGNSLTLLVGIQSTTATMENSGDSLIELPYDPALPLLGIHTKETRIERDTCTSVFIAALFIIARTWKQFRYPSAFFMVQLSHPYMTTGKTITLTRQTIVGKVMSLLFNMLF